MKRHYYHIVLFIVLSALLHSQNETTKWYFGNGAGLDFSTTTPSILTNGALVAYEGCASISTSTGNLLFYTDGMTIWNQSHSVMANGSGLSGGNTATQSSIIVKQPGSSILYYVFTIDGLAQ